MSIRVILADDHIVTRSGIKVLLECDSRMTVCAEASSGREASKLCLELSPDVVIMDISMPDLNGMEATRQILSTNPGIRVIALSMHAHRRYISGMLKAGAVGYLLKTCSFEELVCAITTVVENKTYLSPSIAETVVKDYLNSSSVDQMSRTADLTGREKEVLQLISEGVPTREIAKRLFVSESTINTHRRQIMEKLNIHSVARLTKFAIQEGLTLLEG
ncbi:MAG: response regulator transcription factor [Proteobacteria bacterium]|nr:response regulator transcription factor [Pseudomonadota bacterium]